MSKKSLQEWIDELLEAFRITGRQAFLQKAQRLQVLAGFFREAA